ncbi:MAG: DNA mismatch repair protein MutS [Acholeplasmataceae bacterium]
MVTKKYTPMIQQYLKIKEDYADAIVFFRLGDFYEMFFDDAIIASKVLEIALTRRDAGEKIPMCGVPHHAVKPYIQKLVLNGFKIAIAEQVTEPGKGLVLREVVKLITPGMIIDDGILPNQDFNFIGSAMLTEFGYSFSYIDISTGDSFIINNLTKKDLYDEIKNISLKEIIITNKSDSELTNYLENQNILITIYDNLETNNLTLTKNINDKETIKVANLLINYLENESKIPLHHLMPFVVNETNNFIKLDSKVLEHLELIDSLSKNNKSTLIYWLDNTKTAMGSRLLKYYLTHPLKNKTLIEERYDLINAYLKHEPRTDLLESLNNIYDINRLVGRISSNNANARDLIQLKLTLKEIPNLKETLLKFDNDILKKVSSNLENFDEITDLLENSIIDNPPILIKEGGLIKPGFNEKLDELNKIAKKGSHWLDDFIEKEREKTGIKNLKVGYNRVFGYYIEVSKGNIPLIKDEYGYIRKQTLSNSERYITDDLKVQEEILTTAKEKSINLEYELFLEIKDEVFKELNKLQILSKTIAEIDVFLNLAIISEKYNYIRPKLNNNKIVEIELGRHPVVERHVEFIANHITMMPDEIFVLTGPNMSGKSTYMRMFALIVIMAQSGFYVPAYSANIPIYDAIYTRIGASDDISSGKSTFMVEMVEANEALSNATANSLILFDELGRGTSTYDGLALAQAMLIYINSKIKAQTIFSTHYHELTNLANNYKNITNIHVKAKEDKHKMVFLYQVEKGASNRSYGIEVASLAHLPQKVIKDAFKILNELEKNHKDNQIDLFSLDEEPKLEYIMPIEISELVDELNNLNLDNLTPIEALVRLKYFQNLLKKLK